MNVLPPGEVAAEESAPESVVDASRDHLVKLSVLVPAWQLAALEEAARQRRLSVSWMLRRVVTDYLAQRIEPAPGAWS
jgi:hypothetical protein